MIFARFLAENNLLMHAAGLPVTLEECVVPTLTVVGAESGPMVTIEELKWVGLRCKSEIAGGEGLTADLRRKVSDPDSSVADEAKEIGDDGSASLIVPDDLLEGEAVSFVVLDDSGRAVARRGTIVGGE